MLLKIDRNKSDYPIVKNKMVAQDRILPFMDKDKKRIIK